MDFSAVSGVEIKMLGNDQLPAVYISNDFCEAIIALQGAQILRFDLKKKNKLVPLLWLSELNQFQSKKAIRGGIPLCFPWFGAHTDQVDYPAHGFARNLTWRLCEITEHGQGHTVILELKDSELTRQYWDYAFCLHMKIECGETLNLEFTLENLDTQPLSFNFAWHSYFPAQIHTAQVHGFEQTLFINQLNSNQTEIQQDEIIQFTQEIDRIYPNTSGCFHLVDEEDFPIFIQTNAPSAVVWNPWIAKAQRLTDVQNDAWQDFVCIECGDLNQEKYKLKAGEICQYRMQIGLTHQQS